jgi:hypothetical protein
MADLAMEAELDLDRILRGEVNFRVDTGFKSLDEVNFLVQGLPSMIVAGTKRKDLATPGGLRPALQADSADLSPRPEPPPRSTGPPG